MSIILIQFHCFSFLFLIQKYFTAYFFYFSILFYTILSFFVMDGIVDSSTVLLPGYPGCFFNFVQPPVALRDTVSKLNMCVVCLSYEWTKLLTLLLLLVHTLVLHTGVLCTLWPGFPNFVKNYGTLLSFRTIVKAIWILTKFECWI